MWESLVQFLWRLAKEILSKLTNHTNTNAPNEHKNKTLIWLLSASEKEKLERKSLRSNFLCQAQKQKESANYSDNEAVQVILKNESFEKRF